MKTPTERLAYITDWVKANREKSRGYKTKWRVNNPSKMETARQNWANRNKARIRKVAALTKVRKYHEDIQRNIEIKTRNKIRGWLKRPSGNRGGRVIELVGGTKEFVRAYLEGLFSQGMSWGNYGFRGWHIHHKFPISNFDLTDPVQLRACFHYTNCQPLWNDDHIRAHGKQPKAA